MRFAGRVLCVCLAWAIAGGCTSPASRDKPGAAPRQPRAEYVLLIGLDGARADAIRDHAGPALRELIDGGTSCWSAQAERPSVTQVNWASILTGSTPATHGIDRHPVTENELATRHVNVPTLFDVVAESGQPAAGFLGHWKLYPNETTAKGVTLLRSPYESRRVAPLAADVIERQRPAFTFVYFGDLDGLGHRHGWMSQPYVAGIADVDRGIRVLLDALECADMRRKTLIVVTSDHGGHGKSHAAGTPDDTAVPLILNGPGVPRGTIDVPVSVTSIAPAILHAIGLPRPTAWDGKLLPSLIPTDASPGRP